jgi:ABC-type multidrug transport system fused ATPase/permease subunit
VLVSTFFSNSRTAAIVGCIIFFCGFFVFVGLQNAEPTRAQILAACLHPAAAFTYGTLAFTEYEGANIGVSYLTWNVSNTYNITFQDALNMMLIDAVWISALAWYVAHIWPSEFGTHKPWYFLAQPSFWASAWRGNVPVVRETWAPVVVAEGADRDPLPPGADTPGAHVEAVPDSLARQCAENTCVDIRDLVKQFHTPTGIKTAVDGLNLTMYSGQITALLGHNGAGKTTAIGMLTGLVAPTSGTAVIEGRDINNSMAEIRKNLGTCRARLDGCVFLRRSRPSPFRTCVQVCVRSTTCCTRSSTSSSICDSLGRSKGSRATPSSRRSRP